MKNKEIGQRKEEIGTEIENHLSQLNQCYSRLDYNGICHESEVLAKLAYTMDYLNRNFPCNEADKLLYVKYKDDRFHKGDEIVSRTLPMKKWIGDWCYGHRFVPYNSAKVLEVELNGEPILEKITRAYHGPLYFETIARYFDWIGKRDAYMGDVGQYHSEKPFEEWLEQNMG